MQKLPARHFAAATNKILQSLGYYYKREIKSCISRDLKTQQQLSKVIFSCYQATILSSLSPLSWIALLILMSVCMKRGGQVQRHEEQIVQSLTIITSIIIIINIYIKKVPDASLCFCASFPNMVVCFIRRWLELLGPTPETGGKKGIMINSIPTQQNFLLIRISTSLTSHTAHPLWDSACFKRIKKKTPHKKTTKAYHIKT